MISKYDIFVYLPVYEYVFDLEDCCQPHGIFSTVLTETFTCVQNYNFFVNKSSCYIIYQ